jgi:putative transposase
MMRPFILVYDGKWGFWQGRFGAVAMDEAHLAEQDDTLVRVAPVLERYGRFAEFLGDPVADEAAWRALRMSETSGRQIGDMAWIESLEARSGRSLKPQKRGPKAKGS